MTLLLSNDDVRALLPMPACLAALEAAYAELAAGRGASRTRSDTLTRTARPDALYSLKSMDGVCPSAGVGAVRINSDVLTWPTRDGNVRREKVPAAPGRRWVGLVLLFSVETGEPLALFPDGELQRLRVGATNGLGAKYLARPDARVVGLLGSGWQARGQVEAVCAVRAIERIRCYSPRREHREAFAREMSARVGVEIEPVASPEAAVDGADIVLCATNSIEPVFYARWLAPGLHLSSIKRAEVEPAAIARADRVVLHTHDLAPLYFTEPGIEVPEEAATRAWRAGRGIDFAALPELKDLVAGRVPGRTAPDQVTCFLNNLGLGYQFAAAGAALYRAARAAGAGRELPTEWFTQDVHP
ncbi:MAG TPA: ornithine cyclodeaminase family protein [Thermodesulfobacteriota bacterium]|nr:ornithine cyclodeaminase family protein [Thermodesulfobacteriota bacterium]